MKPKEIYDKRPSFTLAKRDLAALDMLAEALCLHSRSEVVRCLIRAEVRRIHRHHKNEADHIAYKALGTEPKQRYIYGNAISVENLRKAHEEVRRKRNNEADHVG